MRILALLSFLLSFICAEAQDNLHEHIENGKFYGIFPFVIRRKMRNIISNRRTGMPVELVYQGELNKGIFSDKSDVHFTLDLHFSDSICTIRLFEVVIASAKEQYSPTMNSIGGQTYMGSVKTGVKEAAIQIENITIDKDEFSRKYCEKINNRFLTIMNGLRSTFL